MHLNPTFGGLGSDFPDTCPIKALWEGFYAEVWAVWIMFISHFFINAEGMVTFILPLFFLLCSAPGNPFTLGSYPNFFSFGSWLAEGKLVSSKSSSAVVFLPLHKVACIFSRTFYWCFPRFASSVLSLITLFVFLDPCPLTILFYFILQKSPLVSF